MEQLAVDSKQERPRLGPVGIALVALEAFLGVCGIVSGAMMVADPLSGLGMGLGTLHGSPFEDFLIPGITLLVAVGIFPLMVAGAAVVRARWVPLAHVVVGAVLMGWIVIEMLMLGYISALQPAVVGFAIVLLGLSWWNLRAQWRRG
jgi:hypothetical protein